MQINKRIVLQPTYMNKFHCIGSKCEDTCCIGWKVDIDKKTFMKYKKNNNIELKPIFQKNITRKHNNKSDMAYGSIKMNNENKCPFLDKELLCKIHGILGEEYLSDTCALYPRVVKQVDGKLERGATVSCPEIARLALLNPNGIEFEQIEEENNIRILVNGILETNGILLKNNIEKYFWDIRIFSLTLLQNRQYSLGERLIILGIIYNKIEKLQELNRLNEIDTLLESFNKMINEGDFKKELNNVPQNLEAQLIVAKSVSDGKVIKGIANKRYAECLEETMIGLECHEEKELENILLKYKDNFNLYYVPYLKEKEHILENFLVNEYYKDMMPFGDYKDIWESYISLCITYSVIKFHLIGMSGYNKGLSDDLVVKLIQSFSKVVLHDNAYVKSIIQAIKDNGYDTLAYMSVLVNN